MFKRASIIISSIVVILSVLTLAYVSAQVNIGETPSEINGVYIAPAVITGGNSSFNETLTDELYLRLDAFNDPYQANLDFGGFDIGNLGSIDTQDLTARDNTVLNGTLVAGASLTIVRSEKPVTRIDFDGSSNDYSFGTDSSGNFQITSLSFGTRVFSIVSAATADTIRIWADRIDFNDASNDMDFNIEPWSSRDNRRPFSYDAGLNKISFWTNLFAINGTDNSTTFSGTVNYVDIDYSEMPYGYEQTWWNLTNTPIGMFWLNGTELSRANNAECYAIYGIQFGNTSETTFKLPDIRGRNILHYNATNFPGGVGTKGGEYNHTQTIAELASHDHSYNYPSTTTFAAGVSTGANPLFAVGSTTGSAGTGQAFNVLDPYIVAGGKIVRC